jgi:hypothetical protein
MLSKKQKTKNKKQKTKKKKKKQKKKKQKKNFVNGTSFHTVHILGFLVLSKN